MLLQTVLVPWLKTPLACKWELGFLWDAISAPCSSEVAKIDKPTKMYESSKLHVKGWIQDWSGKISSLQVH